MKFYLSGPMRGYDENNFPAFRRAAALLRARGIEVVSPHELDLLDDPANLEEQTTKWFMMRDLPAMLDCDGIALLPGWENSTGARIEFSVATMVGMSVHTVDFLLKEGSSAEN